PRAFRTGIPDLESFPFKLWQQLTIRYLRHFSLLSYADPRGYQPLREAIAGYLREARAVRGTADQVIIVSGTQQAIDLCARILLDPGDAVWIEEPGYLAARAAFLSAGAHLVPVPIDAEGLKVEMGIQRAPEARMVYVTPAHQHPLGVTFSLARRLALLKW